ncbi:hypothetical protein M1446_00630 [Candidatus Dependentiae bacterium]|nr:hypothetical protein [Candidatus Dependentiae bacterium]
MKKIIYILGLFFTTLSLPKKNILKLMPVEIWKYVGSYLEPNDKALVLFMAPRFGLTGEQAVTIAEDINQFYLNKSETLEDQIYALGLCRSYKTCKPPSNARTLIVKELKKKIPRFFILYRLVSRGNFDNLKIILKEQLTSHIKDYSAYNQNQNFEKLKILDTNFKTDLKTLELIIKDIENCKNAFEIYLFIDIVSSIVFPSSIVAIPLCMAPGGIPERGLLIGQILSTLCVILYSAPNLIDCINYIKRPFLYEILGIKTHFRDDTDFLEKYKKDLQDWQIHTTDLLTRLTSVKKNN